MKIAFESIRALLVSLILGIVVIGCATLFTGSLEDCGQFGEAHLKTYEDAGLTRRSGDIFLTDDGAFFEAVYSNPFKEETRNFLLVDTEVLQENAKKIGFEDLQDCQLKGKVWHAMELKQ